jgi:hypothetical protein
LQDHPHKSLSRVSQVAGIPTGESITFPMLHEEREVKINISLSSGGVLPLLLY